jgi:hypothetical protein
MSEEDHGTMEVELGVSEENRYKLSEIIRVATEESIKLAMALNGLGFQPSPAANLGMLKLAIDTAVTSKAASMEAHESLLRVFWTLAESPNTETVDPVPVE